LTKVPTANTEYIDERGSPFATFNFRYLSTGKTQIMAMEAITHTSRIDALRALCIIARSPGPVSLEDRPLEELSPEEMRELLRLQRVRPQSGDDMFRISDFFLGTPSCCT